MSDFATRLIRWQRQHGRHGLPWQGADAYCVWLSEIMLQQTQVATVIPYYRRFVTSFPDLAALAAASEDEVLAHWSGLGYYSRARNLHVAAQLIMQRHDGAFPHHYDDILALPGIGRSTAAAISALVFHERRAILDGNVKRILARYCAIEGYTGEKKIEAQLWQQAEALLPVRDVATYTQGLMDLGALLCTRSKPQCALCPLQKDCAAYQSGRVAQLPTPRPRKVLPEKHSTFLLLLNGSDILLEKRPGSGIWGGLWCPPQVEGEENIATYCMQRFGVDATQAVALPEFTHTFTHFKLHIAPLLVPVTHKPGQTQEPGRVWLDMEDALRAAIPSPVRKLIEKIIRV
ncbi:MAG: A/G-specific adenine glycosylase [Nitrosomonadales bacterium]|nr:A/G-specific adenine glycosylase [Nitrosomonadales bacterium]